jgi:hypothetical protein
MSILPQVIFAIVFFIGIGYFANSVRKIARNIKLGQDVDTSDNKPQRWKNMARIALGQSKMVTRPIAGFLHIIVYVGFVVINIEVLEIIIDGFTGQHRIFSPAGDIYNILIGSFELLAFAVLVSVIIFWIRRNVIKLKRFMSSEMKGWPKSDGNIILYFEVVLMCLFLTMNGTDLQLQLNGAEGYHTAGSFPISQWLLPLFDGLSNVTLIIIERTAWWLHIIGILVFLNYLYFSKHLHILLAFPNTFYGI